MTLKYHDSAPLNFACLVQVHACFCFLFCDLIGKQLFWASVCCASGHENFVAPQENPLVTDNWKPIFMGSIHAHIHTVKICSLQCNQCGKLSNALCTSFKIQMYLLQIHSVLAVVHPGRVKGENTKGNIHKDQNQ